MSDSFAVRSSLSEYSVDFVDKWSASLSGIIEGDPFFFLDKGVLDLYESVLGDVLRQNRWFAVEATELNKTLDRCQEMIRDLVEKNIRKNSVLVAIGGGVLQDITGFIASVLYRGIGWYFIPTTLLSQADSCIGSKTSINLGPYKNLLGNFYPPSRIWIDVSFLATLPAEEIKSGIGEILHFYLIDDSPLIGDLMKSYDGLVSDPLQLAPYIHESLRIKKEVVERDEFDRGERNLFNYGHTFGHALESVTRYRVNHGQAVTWGMDLANFLSVQLGYMSAETYGELHLMLKRNMPVLDAADLNMDDYLRALGRDKKNVGSSLVCILSRGPGHMFKTQVLMDTSLRSAIVAYLEAFDGEG